MSILNQVLREKSLAESYTRAKKIQYRERIIKYDNQKRDKNKLNIHLVANVIDTLLATTFQNGLSQRFVSRDGWIGLEKAQKLNFVAKFDQQDQDFQQLYYQKEFDRYFYGVGIRVLMGFDDTKLAPWFVTVNPLNWYPDPLPSQTGKYGVENFRFMGFMFQTSLFDLRDDPEINKESVYKLAQATLSSDTRLNKIAESTSGNYLTQFINGINENFTTEIYNHFTIWEGKKYIVKCNPECTLLYSMKEVPAVLKSEQLSPKNVKWPVALNYYEPLRNDAYGKSLWDRLEDKQDAISILFNLNMIKSKREALGGDFLVNSRIIKNPLDLTKPTTDSRFLVADVLPGESLANAMMEVPRSMVKADSINMINQLYQESINDTGIDRMQMGLPPDRNMTATESQTIQANANLKNILKNNINAWGDKDFWQIWYKEYVYKFSKADKKFIALKNDFEYQTLTLDRTDFIGNEDPYIEVDTASEIDGIDKEMLQKMMLERPQFLQSSAPEVSKLIFLRCLYRLMGYSENQINMFVPLTPNERLALSYVSIVNLNQVPKSIFENPNLDLFTLYIYMQKADETEAKQAVLDTLTQVMLQQGLSYGLQPTEGGQAAGNQATGIQMSQAVQAQQPKALARGQSLQPTQVNG